MELPAGVKAVAGKLGQVGHEAKSPAPVLGPETFVNVIELPPSVPVQKPLDKLFWT
jgi:hypothetical protein